MYIYIRFYFRHKKSPFVLRESCPRFTILQTTPFTDISDEILDEFFGAWIGSC